MAFFVTGKEYFGAVKNAIDQATSTVCVAGWRIEPQTPLQRNPTVSVVDVLGNAVKRGVRVCVLYVRVVRARVCARVRARACVRACACACVRVCVCVVCVVCVCGGGGGGAVSYKLLRLPAKV